MSEVRFHFDEHVDPRIAASLRLSGIDATTTVEARLRMTSDETQWAYSQRAQRIMVTCDPDFFELVKSDSEHAGLVYFNKDTRSIGDVVEWLTLIHGAMSAEDMRGKVEYVPSRS